LYALDSAWNVYPDNAMMASTDRIFRLTGASKRDPAVADWLQRRRVEQRAIVKSWFARMRECGPDVVELMHDGCPVACVGDVPFGYVNAFTNHVNVGFFNGAALHDPARLLEGTGRRMRHVKLKPGHDIDDEALGALIDAAYADCKAVLRAGESEVPPAAQRHGGGV
jgi:hypothetical protein